MKKILVLAAAVVFALGMSTPSWAVADFAIGGSVRIDSGWIFSDLGDTQGIGNEDSQTNFFLINPGNGRINFKATVADVTGFIEFGLGPSLRHIYAEWDMGGGASLLFGHTWSIMSFGFTDQRMNWDDANIGFGCLYFGRHPQIRYTYAAETFTLKVAIEDNDVAAPAGLVAANYLAETIIPALVASVTFTPVEMLTLTPSGFYQMYDLTGIAPGTRDVDVDAYALALDGSVSLEMAKISFEFWWGQNLGVVADAFDLRPAAATVAMGFPVVNAAGTDAEDVNAYGGFVQLSFPLETFALNIGAGYQESDVENSPSANFESDISAYSFFVNVLYNLTDSFYIQPEISYFDYGDDGTKNAFGAGKEDLGSDIWVGIHLQADF